MTKKNKLLGDFLVNRNLITSDQLEQALHFQKTEHKLLGHILIELGFLKEEEMISFLGEHLGVKIVSLKDCHVSAELLQLVPEKIARKYQVQPLFRMGDLVTVAMVNPLDLEAIDVVGRLVQLKIEPVLATQVEINEAIRYNYSKYSTPNHKNSQHVSGNIPGKNISLLNHQWYHAVYWIEELLERCIKFQFNSITFRATQSAVRTFLKTPFGVFEEKTPSFFTKENLDLYLQKKQAKVSSSKKLSIEQGSFQFYWNNQKIVCYISGIKTSANEVFTITIHNLTTLASLKQIGFSEIQIEAILQLVAKGPGLLCVQAAPGNGKTTTMRALANDLSAHYSQIISLHKDIEIPFHQNVVQLPVVGLKAALWDALYGMIRKQKPELIFLDDFSTRKNLKWILQLVSEGYFVIMTCPLNKCTAWIESAINQNSLYSTILQNYGLISRQLVGRLCNYCKQEIASPKSLTKNIPQLQALDQPLYRKKGCSRCYQTGYRGMSGLSEIRINSNADQDGAPAKYDNELLPTVIIEDKNLFEHGLERINSGEVALNDILDLRSEI